MIREICEKVLTKIKPISDKVKMIYSDDFTEDR